MECRFHLNETVQQPSGAYFCSIFDYNQCPQECENYSNLHRKFAIPAKIKALFLVSSPATAKTPPRDCEFPIPGDVKSKVVMMIKDFGGIETVRTFLNAPIEHFCGIEDYGTKI